MMLIRPQAVLASAFLAVSSTHVLGQTASPSSGAPAAKATELDTVVVRSTQDRDDRRESTASKTVVTKEDLVRYGDTNVADVLKRLPGVTVGGTPGRGGGADIRMRGLGGGYTSIMLNSERMPPGFSLDSLSPDLIERIEIYKSVTADKSAQAVAGGINIILKQAVRQAQHDLKAFVGSERGRPTASIGGQTADRAGAVSYVLGAELRNDRYALPSKSTGVVSDATGSLTSVKQTDTFVTGDVTTLTLTPRLSWTIDAGNTLSAEAFVLEQRQQSDVRDQVHTDLGSEPVIDRTDTDNSRGMSMVRGRVNWMRKLEEGAQLELKFGGASSRRTQDNIYDYLDTSQTLLKRSTVDGPSAERSINLSGKYRAPVVTDHALSTGWDVERARRSESRVQTDLVYGGGLTADDADEAFSAKVNRLAVFAQDEWELSPNWSLYEGLRWESIETRTTGAASGEVINRSHVLSPILQSLWKVPDTKGDQVRLGLSRTYKAPNTRDLSPRRYLGATDNTPTSPDSEGNAALRPELAWGLDLAYERYLSESGVLSAGIFARQIHDVIVQELYLDQARWVSRPANGGNARTAGVELEAKTNLKQWFTSAPRVDLRLNVARNWSSIDSVPGPHNRLAQQTPLSANLGLDWRPASTALIFGGNLGVTTGGPASLPSNQTASNSIRRQLDAYGLWKVDPKLQWRLSFNNLLQQDQLADATYKGSTSTVAQQTVVPSVASVRLAVEVKI